jgi:hypothetical protein
MLPDDWLEQLQHNRLEFDCDQITLTQNDTERPTSFTGPGYVKQGAEGALAFKLYANGVGNFSPYDALTVQQITEGKLAEGRHYYTLSAVDRAGWQWSAERIIPDVSSSLREDGQTTYTVTGQVYELMRSRGEFFPPDHPCLSLHFFGDIDVPGNTRARTTRVIAGESYHSWSALNVAVFSVCGCDFRIHARPGVMTVEVSSPSPLPPYLEVRVVEALRFVLAKPLSWTALELQADGVGTVRIRYRRPQLETRLQPPISDFTLERYGYAWELFGKYLAFVLPHGKATFHPCSARLSSVMAASALSIDAEALALSLAIEGLTKTLYHDLGHPSQEFADAVARLQAHVLAWDGFKGPPEVVRLKDRLPGLLGHLTRVGPKDRLHALAARKKIAERHIKVWERLRHPAAHAEAPGSRSLQELVDQCNTVTVLMYHLVFGAIGYDGKYSDYSTHGYPVRRYLGRPVTREDVAVVAYHLWKARGCQHGGDVADWLRAEKLLESGLV